MAVSGRQDGMAESRPIVLGSDGRAGRAIARRLAEVAPETVAATRIELDITDYFNLCWEFERLKADLVVNAAAWTDVDGCETDARRAFEVNAEGARNVARAAAACGARAVHLSTDYVFDGHKGEPYTEDDLPAPLSVYGKSKAAGEIGVLAENADALVIRTAWLFGGGGRRPDFVSKILAAVRSEQPIPVVEQRGNPTAVADLAEGLIALLAAGARGVVHLTCGGETDRASFAAAVLEEAGLDPRWVVPVRSAPSPAGAPRPNDSRLSLVRFEELAGITPRPWREALREVIAGGRSS